MIRWLGVVAVLAGCPSHESEDRCPDDVTKVAPGICGCGVRDDDSDGDRIADCEDACPHDVAKTDPGLCGCGTADADADVDGVPDCTDLCADDPAKTEPGACGCGTVDTDEDDDGLASCVDLCPTLPSADDQDDDDLDGVGDVCDNCPTVPNVDQEDLDTDGVGDLCWCDPKPAVCENGHAGDYPCENVDLVAFLDLVELGAGSTNDVWGWTDPDTAQEYVLLGTDGGVVFYDITNPYCPEQVGRLPTATSDNLWRDVETYDHYLYVGSEADFHGIQIFDLDRLAEYAGEPLRFDADGWYQGVGASHTIAIDPVGGYLSANGSTLPDDPQELMCGGGLNLIDLANPLDPEFRGCYPNSGYVHDALCLTYHGPDVEHDGMPLCITANGSFGDISTVDVTDLANPVELGDSSYPQAVYAHQGALTEDLRYFLLDDELDEQAFGVGTTTRVFDLVDLENPTYIGAYRSPNSSIDHNQFVAGDRLYQANYTSGLRILDLAGVANTEEDSDHDGVLDAGEDLDGDGVLDHGLVEIGYFDVLPGTDAAEGAGSWSTYPWFASGVLPVTSIYEGLFLVRPTLPE